MCANFKVTKHVSLKYIVTNFLPHILIALLKGELVEFDTFTYFYNHQEYLSKYKNISVF